MGPATRTVTCTTVIRMPGGVRRCDGRFLVSKGQPSVMCPKCECFMFNDQASSRLAKAHKDEMLKHNTSRQMLIGASYVDQLPGVKCQPLRCQAEEHWKAMKACDGKVWHCMCYEGFGVLLRKSITESDRGPDGHKLRHWTSLHSNTGEPTMCVVAQKDDRGEPVKDERGATKLTLRELTENETVYAARMSRGALPADRVMPEAVMKRLYAVVDRGILKSDGMVSEFGEYTGVYTKLFASAGFKNPLCWDERGVQTKPQSAFEAIHWRAAFEGNRQAWQESFYADADGEAYALGALIKWTWNEFGEMQLIDDSLKPPVDEIRKATLPVKPSVRQLVVAAPIVLAEFVLTQCGAEDQMDPREDLREKLGQPWLKQKSMDAYRMSRHEIAALEPHMRLPGKMNYDNTNRMDSDIPTAVLWHSARLALNFPDAMIPGMDDARHRAMTKATGGVWTADARERVLMLEDSCTEMLVPSVDWLRHVLQFPRDGWWGFELTADRNRRVRGLDARSLQRENQDEVQFRECPDGTWRVLYSYQGKHDGLFLVAASVDRQEKAAVVWLESVAVGQKMGHDATREPRIEKSTVQRCVQQVEAQERRRELKAKMNAPVKSALPLIVPDDAAQVWRFLMTWGHMNSHATATLDLQVTALDHETLRLVVPRPLRATMIGRSSTTSLVMRAAINTWRTCRLEQMLMRRDPGNRIESWGTVLTIENKADTRPGRNVLGYVSYAGKLRTLVSEHVHYECDRMYRVGETVKVTVNPTEKAKAEFNTLQNASRTKLTRQEEEDPICKLLVPIEIVTMGNGMRVDQKRKLWVYQQGDETIDLMTRILPFAPEYLVKSTANDAGSGIATGVLLAAEHGSGAQNATAKDRPFQIVCNCCAPEASFDRRQIRVTVSQAPDLERREVWSVDGPVLESPGRAGWPNANVEHAMLEKHVRGLCMLHLDVRDHDFVNRIPNTTDELVAHQMAACAGRIRLIHAMGNWALFQSTAYDKVMFGESFAKENLVALLTCGTVRSDSKMVYPMKGWNPWNCGEGECPLAVKWRGSLRGWRRIEQDLLRLILISGNPLDVLLDCYTPWPHAGGMKRELPVWLEIVEVFMLTWVAPMCHSLQWRILRMHSSEARWSLMRKVYGHLAEPEVSYARRYGRELESDANEYGYQAKMRAHYTTYIESELRREMRSQEGSDPTFRMAEWVCNPSQRGSPGEWTCRSSDAVRGVLKRVDVGLPKFKPHPLWSADLRYAMGV